MHKRFLLLALCFNTACTSARPVPAHELQARHLVGRWSSGIYWINIYCSGAVSYQVPFVPGNALTAMAAYGKSPEEQTAKSTASHIAEIKSDEIILGSFIPVTKEVLKINAWPAKTEKGIQMTVDGQTYILKEERDCSQ